MNLTNIPRDHVQFYALGKKIGFRESQNTKSGSHKTKIFIDKVPFTIHPLVGLTHHFKRTNALAQLLPPIMSIEVSFVTPGTEKIEKK